MAKTFKVEIVTPEATALSAEASALQVPAWEGYLGVLAGHAPLLTVLRPGVLTVRDADGKPTFFAIRGGFMEVTPARTIVLADAIERAQEIDAEAARKALDAAVHAPQPAMPPASTGNADARQQARDVMVEERELAVQWAEARVHAVERSREAA